MIVIFPGKNLKKPPCIIKQFWILFVKIFVILAFPNVGWIIELQGTEEAKPEPNLSPRNLGKVFIPYPTPVRM